MAGGSTDLAAGRKAHQCAQQPLLWLFPRATLPLRVIESHFVAAFERALNQVDVPYSIGVIQIHRDPTNRRMKSASIGTTAEEQMLVEANRALTMKLDEINSRNQYRQTWEAGDQSMAYSAQNDHS
ncbi:Lon, substrate-binding domain [Sesbania bispinosa]|nr:Lon, substrate-binding domain [Sesbania bispinosa]